ncbi:MAG TPA: Wadjet anti-phage system protein JetD domain-containing protein [Steroidobacter sp.]|nr:Wadjet anti-phage system protein JetD domain-containing protein [Steroidobacter sp.]
MGAPSWLQDEPEIQALLAAALDRFDQQSGEQRRRATFLPAQQYLGGLAKADEAADHTWALIRELASSGVLEIRPGKRGSLDPDWQGAKLAFAPGAEAVLREWLERPAAASPMAQWRGAVEEHAHLFPRGHEVLLTKRISLAGRSDHEVVAALASLAAIARPATLRQLSTLAFWGDSKVLDDRGELIAALFPDLQIRERAIVVAVHLPERVAGVLFIENQDNYSAAIDGKLAAAGELAVVYLHGFRGTAARIRTRQGVHLHFGGSGIERRNDFERWWFDADVSLEPLYFWGDLDFASMQMLKTLRQRFEGITAWRPGYGPMLTQLAASGGGNRPMGHRQVDPGSTGCAFADEVLLPAVRLLGCWDQERLAD